MNIHELVEKLRELDGMDADLENARKALDAAGVAYRAQHASVQRISEALARELAFFGTVVVDRFAYSAGPKGVEKAHVAHINVKSDDFAAKGLG